MLFSKEFQLIDFTQKEFAEKEFEREFCRFQLIYDICSPKKTGITLKYIKQMSRICEITGKKAIVGNKVSHSNAKTKRKFNVNLQVKRFFLPEENKWISLRLSTSALRTINKNGIDAVIKEARAQGFLKK